jgi:hypothetical protein
MNKFIPVGRNRYVNVDNIRFFKIHSKDFYPCDDPYSPKICIRDNEPYVLEIIYVDNKIDYFHLTKRNYNDLIEIINKGE